MKWADWFKCEELLDIDESATNKLELFRMVDNHFILVEFLAKLSSLLSILTAQAAFHHLKPENPETKDQVISKVETLRAVIRLLEELIPTDHKERFNDARRTIARASERTTRN